MNNQDFVASAIYGDNGHAKEVCSIVIPKEIEELWTEDEMSAISEQMLNIFREAYETKTRAEEAKA